MSKNGYINDFERANMKEENEIKIKQSVIPEFSSGSSTRTVAQGATQQHALKTLKPVQGLANKNAHGFTLIELLVVVLIIGILAAIALPQYQKAVKRARIAEYEVNLKALAEAEHAYYLENSNYTEDITKLDIKMPECKLLPGLNSMVKSCSYSMSSLINGSDWVYQKVPSVKLRASSFPLDAIFILPIHDQLYHDVITLQAGRFYCYSFMGLDCNELGFTIPIQVARVTFYSRP